MACSAAWHLDRTGGDLPTPPFPPPPPLLRLQGPQAQISPSIFRVLGLASSHPPTPTATAFPFVPALVVVVLQDQVRGGWHVY